VDDKDVFKVILCEVDIRLRLHGSLRIETLYMPVTTSRGLFIPPCGLFPGRRAHPQLLGRCAAAADPQSQALLAWLRESGLPAQKVPILPYSPKRPSSVSLAV